MCYITILYNKNRKLITNNWVIIYKKNEILIILDVNVL